MDKKTIRGNNAIDALRKIRSLIDAAQHLNATDEECELRLELMGIVVDVADRALEGKA